MIPADQFLTAELWGVGNTGLWLHDGRAGTLREAILLHGEDEPPAAGDPGRSEAQESRDAFVALVVARSDRGDRVPAQPGRLLGRRGVALTPAGNRRQPAAL